MLVKLSPGNICFCHTLNNFILNYKINKIDSFVLATWQKLSPSWTFLNFAKKTGIPKKKKKIKEGNNWEKKER